MSLAICQEGFECHSQGSTKSQCSEANPHLLSRYNGDAWPYRHTAAATAAALVAMASKAAAHQPGIEAGVGDLPADQLPQHHAECVAATSQTPKSGAMQLVCVIVAMGGMRRRRHVNALSSLTHDAAFRAIAAQHADGPSTGPLAAQMGCSQMTSKQHIETHTSEARIAPSPLITSGGSQRGLVACKASKKRQGQKSYILRAGLSHPW